MKNKLLISLFLLSALSFNSQIVGGGYTAGNEFPWMVDLGGVCGASLISPDWIVTAGHCVVSPSTIAVGDSVKINSYIKSNNQIGTETRAISEIHIFPGYSISGSTYRPDVALVKLSTPSSHLPVDYITNLSDTSLTEAGDSCTALGWGSINFAGDQSDTLKKVGIEFINKTFCQTQYSGSVMYQIDSTHCAGYVSGSPQSGAGAGDSGGPLFVIKGGSPLLVGVVSGGQNIITTQNYPGIYTSILPVSDWITMKLYQSAGLDFEVYNQYINVYNSQHGITIDSKISINGPMEFSVFDVRGKRLSNKLITINQGRSTYNLNTLNNSGLYIITLRGKQTFLTYKIIVAE